jgi:hypothetical protein
MKKKAQPAALPGHEPKYLDPRVWLRGLIRKTLRANGPEDHILFAAKEAARLRRNPAAADPWLKSILRQIATFPGAIRAHRELSEAESRIIGLGIAAAKGRDRAGLVAVCLAGIARLAGHA